MAGAGSALLRAEPGEREELMSSLRWLAEGLSRVWKIACRVRCAACMKPRAARQPREA